MSGLEVILAILNCVKMSRSYVFLTFFILGGGGNVTLRATGACPDAPNRVFVLAGSVSSDRLGAWYLEKIRERNYSVVCEAVGGEVLASAGATIYKRSEELTFSLVSVSELIRHVAKVRALFCEVAQHICAGSFDEVVLVDTPVINLFMARWLKRHDKNISITYVAPPELWLWGTWGIDYLLRSYCDRKVVLYPFEPAWYAKRGLQVEWKGYPFYHDLAEHFASKRGFPSVASVAVHSR